MMVSLRINENPSQHKSEGWDDIVSEPPLTQLSRYDNTCEGILSLGWYFYEVDSSQLLLIF